MAAEGAVDDESGGQGGRSDATLWVLGLLVMLLLTRRQHGVRAV